VVDPGHGGIDGGTTGAGGVVEKDLNLDIALTLSDFLAFFGLTTAYTRTEDISLYTKGSTIHEKKVSDLENRVAFVKAIDSPVYLSIHQNYYSGSKISGAQVFYNRSEGSEALAKLIQSRLLEFLEQSGRQAAKAPSTVYIMKKIDCPGVIVECGFISNPAEEARLCDKSYQSLLCFAITAGLLDYLTTEY
jgi:N-acetylmuramoyl-L-alanine amidase